VVGHLPGELGARDGFESGIVLDEVGVEDLAAYVFRIQEDRLHVGARGVETRRKSGGAAADDDEIEILQLKRPFRKALSH
jgi:hypothetical protein